MSGDNCGRALVSTEGVGVAVCVLPDDHEGRHDGAFEGQESEDMFVSTAFEVKGDRIQWDEEE